MPATVGRVSFLIFQSMACSFVSVVKLNGSSGVKSLMDSFIISTCSSNLAGFAALVSTRRAVAAGDIVLRYCGIPGVFSTDLTPALSMSSTAETGCCFST